MKRPYYIKNEFSDHDPIINRYKKIGRGLTRFSTAVAIASGLALGVMCYGDELQSAACGG